MLLAPTHHSRPNRLPVCFKSHWAFKQAACQTLLLTEFSDRFPSCYPMCGSLGRTTAPHNLPAPRLPPDPHRQQKALRAGKWQERARSQRLGPPPCFPAPCCLCCHTSGTHTWIAEEHTPSDSRSGDGSLFLL